MALMPWKSVFSIRAAEAPSCTHDLVMMFKYQSACSQESLLFKIKSGEGRVRCWGSLGYNHQDCKWYNWVGEEKKIITHGYGYPRKHIRTINSRAKVTELYVILT